MNAIKVAIEVGKGIAVHAKGTPATIVAVGAAAGVAVIAVAVGYGAYEGGKLLLQKKGLIEKE
ncbi:MAG: hypothetical protein LBP68_00425 [Acidobacteriota bacterium]|jgi:hypothetical protein|nr:hypothetical protein [Acidobacteriota bacterium]